MPDNAPVTPQDIPLQFAFTVSFGEGDPVAFSEVSGLTVDANVVEHREGTPRAARKLPPPLKFDTLTLKRGMAAAGNPVFRWWSEIMNGFASRKQVTIWMVDAAGHTQQSWVLTRAFPIRLSQRDASGTGSEIAIEVIELSYEGLEVTRD